MQEMGSGNESVNLFLSYENKTLFKRKKKKHLPVTIVTGFLGSGKTSLLNHILTNKQSIRIGVAVNDFASLNVDATLIRAGNSDSIVELSNGCLCCKLADDVRDTVWNFLNKDDNDSGNIDYLIIETSGLSDPNSLIRSLDKNFGKLTRARLDSVITVVDVDAFWQNYFNKTSDDTETSKTPSNMIPTALSQIKCADIIVLNKIDLVSTEEVDAVLLLLQEIQPGVRLLRTVNSVVPLPAILDLEYAETIGTLTHEAADRVLVPSIVGGSLRRNGDTTSCSTHTTTLDRSDIVTHRHTSGYYNSISIDCIGYMKLSTFTDILKHLPSTIIRAKGILHFKANDYEDDESGEIQHYNGGINKKTQYVFHISGRQRYQCESSVIVDDQHYPSTTSRARGVDAKYYKRSGYGNSNNNNINNNMNDSTVVSGGIVQLVFIGTSDEDLEILSKAIENGINRTKKPITITTSNNLNTMLHPGLDGSRSNNTTIKKDRQLKIRMERNALIASDKRFELINGDFTSGLFRLTGESLLGASISLKDLRYRFGIDIDAMNIALCDAINALPMQSTLILPALTTISMISDNNSSKSNNSNINDSDIDQSHTTLTVLKLSSSTLESFSSDWNVVQEVSEGILKKYFRNVKHCLCDL